MSSTTRNHRTAWKWSGKGHDPNGSPNTYGASGTGWDDSFVASGGDMPGWRWVVSHGFSATNNRDWVGWSGEPLSFDADIAWYLNGGTVESNFVGGGTYMPSLPTIASVPASVVTSVHNRAISKFLSACEDSRSAFQSGQDIGELKETLETTLNPMRGLRDLTLSYIDKAKRIARRKGGGPSISKALADAYLEYRFGWNPLAADVASGIASIHKQHMSQWTSASCGASAPFTSNEGTWQINIIGGAMFFPYRVTGTYYERYRGSINNGSVNGTRSLGQELQLDLPHFLPTVWNLIPYSWVVDYFTNVGDIIDSSCFASSNLRWVCLTTRTEHLISFKPGSWLNGQGNPSFTKRGYVTVSATRMRRIHGTRSNVSPSSLVPSLEFHIPLSSRPWENIGALLASRLL